MAAFPPLSMTVRFFNLAETEVEFSDCEFSEMYPSWLVTHFYIPYKTVTSAYVLF